jgi:hypothetical protein
MILVPYFWDTANPNWTTLGVFLSSGGKEAWDLDDSETDAEIMSQLLENGFPVTDLTHVDNIVYARIDLTRLKMDHFYHWSEVNYKSSEEDVWRTFKIPNALWSCTVFKEHFWKSAALPFDGSLVPTS